MTVLAFVLLNLKRGGETNIIEKLKILEGIEEVSKVFGGYDAILKIRKPSSESLQKFLTHDLRTINEIEKTTTMILHE